MIDSEKLAGLEFFKGLPERALRAIAAVSREMSCPSGTVIFSPEQPSQWFYVLVEGSVRVTVFASPLPAPVTITVLATPGQAFGFSSVLGQGHHNSSAEAVGGTRIIAVDAGGFLEYLESDPAAGFLAMKRVAQVISRRLAATRKLLLETIVDYERPAGSMPEN